MDLADGPIQASRCQVWCRASENILAPSLEDSFVGLLAAASSCLTVTPTVV